MMEQRFYSTRQWRSLSSRYRKVHPLCVRCGKRAEMVDHITSIKAAPMRKLDPSNLQSMCWACHNRLTKAYDAGSLRGACDEQGNTLDPNHPWAQASNKAAIAVVNAPPGRVDPMLGARLKRDAARGARR
jgi:hypothetical protein